MRSLNHTSDTKRRLGFVNLNFIIQLQLNPQINENSEKYKTMIKKKLSNAKRQLTNKKMSITSTYLAQVMLRFQEKSVSWRHITSNKFVLSYDHYYLIN
jgi:hypothetical protein